MNGTTIRKMAAGGVAVVALALAACSGSAPGFGGGGSTGAATATPLPADNSAFDNFFAHYTVPPAPHQSPQPPAPTYPPICWTPAGWNHGQCWTGSGTLPPAPPAPPLHLGQP